MGKTGKGLSLLTMIALLGCGAEGNVYDTVESTVLAPDIDISMCSGAYNELIFVVDESRGECRCDMPEILRGGIRVEPLFGPWAPGRLSAYCKASLMPDSPLTVPEIHHLINERYVENCEIPTPPPPPRPPAGSFPNDSVVIGPNHPGLVLQAPFRLADATWPKRTVGFLNEVGAIDVTTANLDVAQTVRLEIIDDFDSGDSLHRLRQADPHESLNAVLTPDEEVGHGMTLARIAEVLTCDPETPAACAVEIRTRNVMDASSSSNQHGTLGKLAQQIYWSGRERPGLTTLNISLGWLNPCMGGFLGGDIFANAREAPAAAAVHEALQYTRCLQNAALAAAGNANGPAGSGLEHDPILPAEWQRQRPTDWSRLCAEEFDMEGVSLPPNMPLITAVGAVGRNERPLALTREHGEPRLVASGMTVVVPRDVGSSSTSSPWSAGRTSMLSGTSGAALVASAAVVSSMQDHHRAYTSAGEAEQALWSRSLPVWPPRLESISYPPCGGEMGGCMRPEPVRKVNLRTMFPEAEPHPLVGVTTTSTITIATVKRKVRKPRRITCPGGFHIYQWERFGLRRLTCAVTGVSSTDEKPRTHPQPKNLGGNDPSINAPTETLTFDYDDKTPYAVELHVDTSTVLQSLDSPRFTEGRIYEVDLSHILRGEVPTSARLLMSTSTGETDAIEISIDSPDM